MKPAAPLEAGAFVRLTLGGSSTAARVLLASSNGHSLLLALEGPLGTERGCYASTIALLRDTDEGPYRDLLLGEEVDLEPLPPA